MGKQRRRTVNLLLQPALQLKLPLFMLAITLAILAFQVAHGYFAYSKLYATIFKEAGSSPVLADLLRGQTRDFIEVSAEIGLLYILVVVSFCVTYAHRMIGPTVAFRRHVEALKNGDYRSRITLRKHDAFSDLADDLNELAQILERDEKQSGSD
jgi:signal transduction histidine kinase